MTHCFSLPDLRSHRRKPWVLVAAALLLLALLSVGARAADRDRVEAFLQVTGFDVALDSIKLTAGAAPRILGMEPDDFGSDWNRLSEDVFDTRVMREIALDILEATLDDEALNHAAAFYATDLGQRFVEAENLSHMIKDDVAKQTHGAALVAEMTEAAPERLVLIRRMNAAIDSSGSSLRALQEIQVRFLAAASAAGVIDLKVDVEELRARIKTQESAWRQMLEESAMAGSAFTYREFSDAEIETYAEALEQPLMQRVYELLNAVQFEIMANRFEILAARMAELHPEQEI